MHHQIVLVSAFFADQLQQPLRAFQIARVGVHEDGAVAVALGGVDVELRHFVHVQVALGRAHLLPLLVQALGGMNFAKGLHGQEKDQLKRGHLSADGLALQGLDKALSGSHGDSPFRLRVFGG